jgi:hypothetical protein
VNTSTPQISRSFLLAICFAGLPAGASGQVVTVVDTVARCDYRLCALAIAPKWNGLAVVRGGSGRAVANLNFFLPRDIARQLDSFDRRTIGSDSAATYVQRAVRLRRAGAFFTDLGLLSVAAAGTRALISQSNKRTNAFVAAAGFGALTISVPLQFAADGALSRAVWWHNLRYARTSQPEPR